MQDNKPWWLSEAEAKTVSVIDKYSGLSSVVHRLINLKQ